MCFFLGTRSIQKPETAEILSGEGSGMSLGQRIRELRQSAGLTQSQLGGRELTKSFISLIERDRAMPSVDTLRILARRLGTSLDGLLGDQGHLPEAAVQSLLALSRDALRQRDLMNAETLLEMARYLGDRYSLEEGTRETELQGATLAFLREEYPKAWSILQTAKAASEAAGDVWRAGRAAALMGQVQQRRREFPEAADLLREALLKLRRARAGRDPVRTEALIALGGCLVRMGRAEDGFRRYQEASNSTAAQRNPWLRGQALWGMAWASRKLGNLGQARTLLLDAKACMEKAEELADLMRVLHNLGQVFLEEGRTAEALRHFHHALRVMDRLGKPDRAAILTEIARAHLQENQLEEAETFAERALQSARDVHDPVEHAEAQLLLARVHLLQGRMKKALPLLQDALSAFRARGMEEKAREALRELGLILRQRGAHAEAATLLALVIDSLPRGETKRP